MTKKKSFFQFKPSEYLHHYYDYLGAENDFLIRVLAKVYAEIKKRKSLLIFGSGPTIYSAITAASHINEIVFADFLSENLNEVIKWKNTNPQAFDWDPYIQLSLKYEGKNTTDRFRTRRRNLIAKKATKFVFCDAKSTFPLGTDNQTKFDVVQMDFVAESITSSLSEFRQIISNTTSLMRKGSYLSMFALKKAKYYLINGMKYPAVPVDKKVLRPIFNSLGLEIVDYDEVVAEKDNGYEGIMYFLCKLK